MNYLEMNVLDIHKNQNKYLEIVVFSQFMYSTKYKIYGSWNHPIITIYHGGRAWLFLHHLLFYHCCVSRFSRCSHRVGLTRSSLSVCQNGSIVSLNLIMENVKLYSEFVGKISFTLNSNNLFFVAHTFE